MCLIFKFLTFNYLFLQSSRGGGYYMTNSYPPSAPPQSAGVANIPRGPPVRPQYSPGKVNLYLFLLNKVIRS